MLVLFNSVGHFRCVIDLISGLWAMVAMFWIFGLMVIV